MVLPASGPISMSQINVELGRTFNTANTSLDAAENGTYATINVYSAAYPNSSNPASMSEWYSYNHSATTTTVGCQCVSNTCTSACVCNGGFCYDVNDCGGNCI